ncbi:TPA: hypothetical protein F8R87_12720 [Legionella pneumophila]|nr:hypothetical protein [Legionella pneumophila]
MAFVLQFCPFLSLLVFIMQLKYDALMPAINLSPSASGKAYTLLNEIREGNHFLKINDFLNMLDLNLLNEVVTSDGERVVDILARFPKGQTLLSYKHELLKKTNLNYTPPKGPYAGTTTLCSLASTKDGRKLLIEKGGLILGGIDFNACPAEGNYAGRSLLWWLVATNEGREWLLENRVLLKQKLLNFNVAAQSGLDRGKSVLWLLAFTSEGRKLLRDKTLNLLAREDLNFHATAEDGKYKGQSVFSLLINNTKTKEFLERKPDLLERISTKEPSTNLNEALDIQLWQLASTTEGIGILKEKYASLLEKGDLNLNVSPKVGKHAGKTLLWLLANNQAGLKLLKDYPQLLEKSDINLNAAPMNGDKAETTVLWLLASTSEGRAILREHPFLLKKTGLNFNATPKWGEDAGVTVLWFLTWSPYSLQSLLEHTNILSTQADLNFNAMKENKTVIRILLVNCIFNGIVTADLPNQIATLLKKHYLSLDLNTLPTDKAGVLFYLTNSEAGLSILEQVPELLLKPGLNLNTAPTGEQSPLENLISSPKGLQILAKVPDVLLKSDVDLNSATAGRASLLWQLVDKPEGLDILIQNPLIWQMEGLDFNAAPTVGKVDTSVLWILASVPRGQELLEQMVHLGFAQNGGLNLNLAPQTFPGNTVAYSLVKAGKYDLLTELCRNNFVDLTTLYQGKSLLEALLERRQYNLLNIILSQYLEPANSIQLEMLLQNSRPEIKQQIKWITDFLKAERSLQALTVVSDFESAVKHKQYILRKICNLENAHTIYSRDYQSFFNFYMREVGQIRFMLNSHFYHKNDTDTPLSTEENVDIRKDYGISNHLIEQWQDFLTIDDLNTISALSGLVEAEQLTLVQNTLAERLVKKNWANPTLAERFTSQGFANPLIAEANTEKAKETPQEGSIQDSASSPYSNKNHSPTMFRQASSFNSSRSEEKGKQKECGTTKEGNVNASSFL